MVRVMLLAALAAVAAAVLSAPVQVTGIVNPPVMTRGVNLGNWFILEPYLGNSVFGGSDAPDEWSLCQELGTDACRQRLTDHWNSWVTQADLQKIKDAGLNSVRIPIGFWSVELRGNEPYVDGQIPVLQKVLGWCKDIGLTALIDLHGVVAGQSANLDTGHQQDREYWTEYDGDHSITLRMLGKLTQAITPYLQANGGPVIGIEGCNEPDRDQVPHDWLADYYTQAYSVVRGNTSGADIEYFYMDQFSPTAWQGFLDGSPNVYQDTHQYFAWSGIDPNNYWNAMGLLCGQSASDVRTVSGQRWLVVGEWALTIGGNPDWTDDYKVFLTQFAQTQINIWETGGGGGQGGWYYWNFKSENGGQNTWDYLSLLDMGIMPNMNDGLPPNHCAGYWASAEGQRFSTYLNETNMDPAAVQLRAVLADPGKLTHLAKKEMEVMKRNFNKNFNERNNLSKDSKHATKHHNNKPRHHVHNSLRRVHNSKP